MPEKRRRKYASDEEARIAHNATGLAWKRRNSKKVQAYRKRQYKLRRARILAKAKAWYDANRDFALAKSAAQSLGKFGLTRETYRELYDSQNGKCAVCGRPETTGRRLAVDHDEKTRAIRGLLCGCCNMGIGQFKHDITNLKSAITYLQKEPTRFFVPERKPRK